MGFSVDIVAKKSPSGDIPAMAKRKWDPLPNLRNSVLPVRVVRVENNPDYPAHTHPFWEFVVVIGGTAVHHVGRTAHPIHAGDVFVLGEKDRHSYFETKNLCLCNILFEYDTLRMDEWETQSIHGF
jgi:quercetin dioxygenase-like cupin family protein